MCRGRRKSDLIVDDDMKRPAGSITVEFTEVKRLLNDALAGKCRVPVNLDTEHATAVEILSTVLFSSSPAHGDWVYKFQVTWVKAER